MKKIMVMIGILMVSAGVLLAGPKAEAQLWNAADASPAIWVKNTFNEVVTCQITGDSSNITVTVGAEVNTIVGTSTANDTVAELEASLAAVTNSAGKTGLEVYRCAPLGTETVDDELLVTTVTLYPGTAGGIVLWDTNDVKHYRAYIPPSDGGASRGQLKIKSVYGDIKGTGNITMKLYSIRNSSATEIDMKEYVSPAYVAGVGSGTNVADEIGPGVIDLPLDLAAKKDDGFLIDAVRATTATTGGIGVRTEAR